MGNTGVQTCRTDNLPTPTSSAKEHLNGGQRSRLWRMKGAVIIVMRQVTLNVIVSNLRKVKQQTNHITNAQGTEMDKPSRETKRAS